MDTELRDRLNALSTQLDRIDQRQRVMEDTVRGLTPVATEAMSHLTAQLADWEARGWFDLVTELTQVLQQAADRYQPEDLRQLSTLTFDVIDTVRDGSQVTPVGPLGLIGASREPQVKRGMAVAMQLLRHLGSVGEGEPRSDKPARRTIASSASNAAPAAASRTAPTPAATPASDVVMWEGHRFSRDGFLLDTAEWSTDLADKMAQGLGIELQDDHWTVLRWVREDYLTNGASPNVRRMASGSGVGTKRMYALFPKTPGKSAAMIAGIPKPVGCV